MKLLSTIALSLLLAGTSISFAGSETEKKPPVKAKGSTHEGSKKHKGSGSEYKMTQRHKKAMWKCDGQLAKVCGKGKMRRIHCLKENIDKVKPACSKALKRIHE